MRSSSSSATIGFFIINERYDDSTRKTIVHMSSFKVDHFEKFSQLLFECRVVKN